MGETGKAVEGVVGDVADDVEYNLGRKGTKSCRRRRRRHYFFSSLASNVLLLVLKEVSP